MLKILVLAGLLLSSSPAFSQDGATKCLKSANLELSDYTPTGFHQIVALDTNGKTALISPDQVTKRVISNTVSRPSHIKRKYKSRSSLPGQPPDLVDAVETMQRSPKE